MQFVAMSLLMVQLKEFPFYTLTAGKANFAFTQAFHYMKQKDKLFGICNAEITQNMLKFYIQSILEIYLLLEEFLCI